MAGPIVRASEFLPQLQSPRTLSWDRAFEGTRQFIFGLCKKAFIADHLAFYVDPVFASGGAYDGLATWIAVLGYAAQIYCDFSGYSDMATGAARTMGFDFNENFRHPYIATSIDSFWRRWHISLSSWLRDYLYIPLGGNRHGEWKTYRNLPLTMLLGGLWHGAAWTFVAWGAIHGLALGAFKWVGSKIDYQPKRGLPRLVHKSLGWLVTMQVVRIGWVFFRAANFDDALALLRRMYVDPEGIAWYPPFALGAIAWVAVTHAIHAT